MRAFLRYAVRRFGQFVLVVFVGINLAFFITHATPIDPIAQAIAAATRFSQSDPQAVEMTRQALRELYGLNGSLWQQYVTFWRRVAVADFGPSLSAFPTPVSTLIWRALPWTFGLLSVATTHLVECRQPAWRPRRLLSQEPLAQAGRRRSPPVCSRSRTTSWPSCCWCLFGFVWPILPITGVLADQSRPRLHLGLCRRASIEHAHPAGALPGPRRHRPIVHRHARAGVQHRHRGLCDLRRTRRRQPAQDPVLLCHAQRHGPAVHRACAVAGPDLQRRGHHRGRVRLSRASAICSFAPSMPATTAWSSASPRYRSSRSPRRCSLSTSCIR